MVAFPQNGKSRIMSTFAITGMGRSGTQFLSKVLALPTDWIVRHEPSEFQSILKTQERFDFQSKFGNYGEVNSYLRRCIISLRVDSKFIILRDPIEIHQSMYNRGRANLPHLIESLKELDFAICSGIQTISFSRMTTDLNYLKGVAHKVGIELPPNVTQLRCNQSTYKKLPDEHQEEDSRRLAWFSELYRSMW